MLQAQAGRPFLALSEAADADIVGVEVYDPATAATVIPSTVVGLAEPRAGTWTIPLLVADVGTYRIRWTDAEGDTTEEDLAVVGVSPMIPSTREVAALLRARTRQTNATFELGDFTEITRPTGTEVVTLIGLAEADVALEIGRSIPPDFEAAVRATIVKRAAQWVELGYQPEATGEDRTVYQSLRLTYEAAVKQLQLDLQWWTLASRGDEIQRITSTATGGTFELGFEGQVTSGGMLDAAAATADEIQAAFEALPGVGAGDVEATGGPLDLAPVVLAFRNALGVSCRQLVTVDNTLATGGTVTVERVRAGAHKRPVRAY